VDVRTEGDPPGRRENLEVLPAAVVPEATEGALLLRPVIRSFALAGMIISEEKKDERNYDPDSDQQNRRRLRHGICFSATAATAATATTSSSISSTATTTTSTTITLDYRCRRRVWLRNYRSFSLAILWWHEIDVRCIFQLFWHVSYQRGY
jgi:hypothetical protein